MKKLIYTILFIISFFELDASCQKHPSKVKLASELIGNTIAHEIKDETLKSWQAYKKYAWGHDVLMPLSMKASDWYDEPLYISPIDAYSTLRVMGFLEEAEEIEKYVLDSLDFNKDVDAKIFEVNIRILGGLLSMYEFSNNPIILDKAKDFADRMLPAFNTATGIPKYWVNLKTGVANGDTVNVAEAASYTFEFGILSYYTSDPIYYQAAKRATLAIYNRKSELGLIGDVINVESGEWISHSSHICSGADSYYEYLYKSYLLFGDPDLKKIWLHTIEKVNTYLPEEINGKLWYGRVDMNTGEHISAEVSLFDAFFPALLSLSGDLKRARDLQYTWNWLWNKYGLVPMNYDYKTNEIYNPGYDLNPELLESAYYLYSYTGDSVYYEMNKKYWMNIKKYCKTEIAFTSIKNVETMRKRDYMPTFFFAETLKYLYLTFSKAGSSNYLDEYIFNTEAHPFKKINFDKQEIGKRLGF